MHGKIGFLESGVDSDKEELAYGRGFPGGSVVKNPPANAGDRGSMPGSGKSPREGNLTHSSILVWNIPWTEEPVKLQGVQRVRHD